jgi:ABC-type transport system substrate-binding protein
MNCDKPETVIGTGAFKCVSYTPGEKVTFARNPYSWRVNSAGQRLPFADGVIIKLIKDLNTRTLQYLNGDLDLVDDIPPPDYKRFKEKEDEGWFDLHRLDLSLNPARRRRAASRSSSPTSSSGSSTGASAAR